MILTFLADMSVFSKANTERLRRFILVAALKVPTWNISSIIASYEKFYIPTGKEEVGASPEDVVEKMTELLSELNDVPDDKVLTAAASFHAKFENIYPFADGNGRAGRLLMNYILIIHNHPPIIIHQEDRREYFDALEAWDSEQELKPLIDFLTQQTEKTWQKQIHMFRCC